MQSSRLTLGVSLIGGVEGTEVAVAAVTYPDDFAEFSILPPATGVDRVDKNGGLWNSATWGPASADVYRVKVGQGRVLVCPAGQVGLYDECVTSLSCLVLDYDGKHGQIESVASVSEVWSA